MRDSPLAAAERIIRAVGVIEHGRGAVRSSAQAPEGVWPSPGVARHLSQDCTSPRESTRIFAIIAHKAICTISGS
jgi:hypothetical protein